MGKALEDRIDKVEDKELKDFDVVKDVLDRHQVIYNAKLDKMAEVSEVYHKNNFDNLKSLVDEVDNMKEAFVVLDGELNKNWEEVKDKILEVQAGLVVQ
jgi:adenylosuccinate synthase